MVVLRAVGDVMLSRLVGQTAEQKRAPYPFEHVASFLKGADIVFGNLEGPLSRRGVAETNTEPDLVFRAPPEMAKLLKSAGFTVLSLANNHILNYGAEALSDTIGILKRQGIRYVGAGMNKEEAEKPVVFDCDNVKIGFLAFTYSHPVGSEQPGCAEMKLSTVKKNVGMLRNKVDVLIVSLHHGIDFVEHPTLWMRDFARKTVEYGADVILGHHPHMIQGIERYKNGLIAYSLGDFVFDHADQNLRKAAYERTAGNFLNRKALLEDDLRTIESIILEVGISKNGVESYQAIPARAEADFQPRIATSAAADKIRLRLRKLSELLTDDSHPIWKQMRLIEKQVRMDNLAQTSFGEALGLIKRIRIKHFKTLPLFLWSKIYFRIH